MLPEGLSDALHFCSFWILVTGKISSNFKLAKSHNDVQAKHQLMENFAEVENCWSPESIELSEASYWWQFLSWPMKAGMLFVQLLVLPKVGGRVGGGVEGGCWQQLWLWFEFEEELNPIDIRMLRIIGTFPTQSTWKKNTITMLTVFFFLQPERIYRAASRDVSRFKSPPRFEHW